MSRKISADEWASAAEPDAGRTWLEFKDDDLIECEAALAHFDEQSFVYYLPAFLRFAVLNHNADMLHSASSLVTSAVHSVTDSSLYSVGRYKKLSPIQRDAVVCFLEFMAEHSEPFLASLSQKSLARYWKTDEAEKPTIIVVP